MLCPPRSGFGIVLASNAGYAGQAEFIFILVSLDFVFFGSVRISVLKATVQRLRKVVRVQLAMW
jgi:hypothetical protein